MFKYLKTFEDFTTDKNDSTELGSAKQFFNKAENDIKEFNSKKINLQNIYLMSKSNDEINNKLKSQKFIDDKGQFVNELLGLWAQLCRKNKDIKLKELQIENIKKNIVDIQKSIDDKKKLLAENPDIKEDADKFISDSGVTLKDANASLQKCNQDIKDLQKNISDVQNGINIKLNSYKQNLNTDKKEIEKTN